MGRAEDTLKMDLGNVRGYGKDRTALQGRVMQIV